MGLGQLIVVSSIIYTIVGVISVLIYDALNEINYKMQVFNKNLIHIYLYD